MTQTLKTSERLGVVDALRGFALWQLYYYIIWSIIICS